MNSQNKRKKPKRPKPGNQVVLETLPLGFLDDLPTEDQKAISSVLGKPIALVAYDEDGRAELEFTDSEGVIHFICVNPNFIRAAKEP